MRMYPLPTSHGWFNKNVLEAVLLAVGLLAILLMTTNLLTQRTQTIPPSVAPATVVRQPISLEYGPSFNPGTGTVYDGKAYKTSAISLAYGPHFNPGTGTVYDGKAYGTLPVMYRPFSLEYGSNFNPGTGTVYDGR